MIQLEIHISQPPEGTMCLECGRPIYTGPFLQVSTGGELHLSCATKLARRFLRRVEEHEDA